MSQEQPLPEDPKQEPELPPEQEFESDRSDVIPDVDIETLEAVVSEISDEQASSYDEVKATVSEIFNDTSIAATEVAEDLSHGVADIAKETSIAATEAAEDLRAAVADRLAEASIAATEAVEDLDTAFSELLDEAPTVQTPVVVAKTVSPSAKGTSLLETAQATWREVQPVLRTQTIRALRTTIRALEGVVTTLEKGAPSPGSASEGILPPTSEAGSGEQVPGFSTGGLQEKFREIWEEARPYWQRFQRWWSRTLPKIRSVLPTSIHEKLSDRALTGAIAGILILVLWTTSGIFSSKPKPTTVATAPPTTVKSPASKSAPPPKVKIPDLPKVSPKPVVTKPAEKPIAERPAAETPIAEKPIAPVPVSSPAPLPSPTPLPSPVPPPLRLTPEQKLIARIQDQVAEISDQYVNGLIQTVQANFRVSRLTVKVGEGWYGLTQVQQDKLANEILSRTQQLNFSKLEITDPQNKLLARNPVVGSEMIILRRSQATI